MIGQLSQLQRAMYAALPASSDSIFIRRWFETLGADDGNWFTYVEFETKKGRVLDITALRAYVLYSEFDSPLNYTKLGDYDFMDFFRWRVLINRKTTMDVGETAAALNLPKPPGEFIVLNKNVLGEAEDGKTHLIIEENSKVQLEAKVDPYDPSGLTFKVGFHMLGRWIPQRVYNRYRAEMRGATK